MKKLIYTAFVICGMLTASCSDLLNLESKTDVTNNYLFTTPEGLNTAVTGLYSLARELPGGADNNESNLYIVTMCDFNTDIAILRAGVSTSIGRLNTSFTPSTGDVNKFWKHHYGIIGKANEIIVAAEALGLDDSDVLHAWSEAKFFRGRSYFELWKRFDRLYLNVTPTTVDNLKREYKPASHEELMTLMTTDLDDAMKGLDWSLPQNNGNVLYGRVTKATAKHVRAQVAMWESDWDTAIEECEDIFKQEGIYSMEKKAENVFNSADLKSPEVLWSFQYSQNLGGGGSGTPVAGHRISIQTTTRINKIAGCINTADQGGYGWGRIYPNTYLLSLMENILNIADMDSRVWEMPREEIEVDACCKECIEGFRPELKPGVELEYVPASGIMAFYAARQWLKMVLVSLLDNAVKFTEEGHIRVSCEEDKSRHVLRFVIEDTGIGIRPDESDRIFERFYKVDTFTKGSGLGLAIANEIMELVGGRIYLDDTYCGGCRFIVEWPMKDKP